MDADLLYKLRERCNRCTARHCTDCAAALTIESLQSKLAAAEEEIIGLRKAMERRDVADLSDALHGPDYKKLRADNKRLKKLACRQVAKLAAAEEEIETDNRLLEDRQKFIVELESVIGRCRSHGSGCMSSVIDKVRCIRNEAVGECIRNVFAFDGTLNQVTPAVKSALRALKSDGETREGLDGCTDHLERPYLCGYCCSEFNPDSSENWPGYCRKECEQADYVCSEYECSDGETGEGE